MKNTIVGIVVGIAVAVTVFHVWYLYKLYSRVVQLESFAIQLTQIINSNQKK